MVAVVRLTDGRGRAEMSPGALTAGGVERDRDHDDGAARGRADRRAGAGAAPTHRGRRRHGHRRRHGARGDRRRRAVRRQPGVPPRRSSTPATSAASPAMPGCFSPTEILAAWEMGADVVKVFPATALGPQFIKDLRGPLPTDQADADRRRARATTPATGSAPARWRSASARRSSMPRPIEARRFDDDHRQNARHSSTPSQTRARHRRGRGSDGQDRRASARSCCGSSPPGFERLLPVADAARATFGGGEANVAVSLAQFGLRESLRDAAAGATRSATRRCRRCAREGVARRSRAARRRSRSGIYFAETGASQRAVDGHLRSRALGDQRDARRGSVQWDAGAGGRRVVPRAPASRPALGATAAACDERVGAAGGEGRGVQVSVDLNFRKKLWSEARGASERCGR